MNIQAVVFLPTNLRDFAQKCSDPHELSLLAKLELIVFDESSNIILNLFETNHKTTAALNPSSAVLLSKTVATWAQNNDGCIVGSRKKYGLLGQRYSELIDRVTNTLISPAFTPDNELEICDLVRLVLAADEVRRNDENSNCMGYQLLASDQVVIMSKLAKMIGKGE